MAYDVQKASWHMHGKEDLEMKRVRSVTLGELVQTVQDIAGSDEEVVAVITHMLLTRRLLRTKAPQAY